MDGSMSQPTLYMGTVSTTRSICSPRPSPTWPPIHTHIGRYISAHMSFHHPTIDQNCTGTHNIFYAYPDFK